MRISIVTINYNNADGLAKTLKSVASQKLLSNLPLMGKELVVEHIIVDGGSTDGSVDVIKDYLLKIADRKMQIEDCTPSGLLKIEVKWVSERDKGIYNAMNKGITMANGEYVMILNSGDCLASETVIAEMCRVIEEQIARPAVLMGNIINVWPTGKKTRELGIGNRKQGTKTCVVEPTLLNFYRGTIPHDAAFIRKDLFDCYGLYDEQMKICSDWKLFLMMMVTGNRETGAKPLSKGSVLYTNIDVVLFDMTGISNNNVKKWQEEKRPVLEDIIPRTILTDYDRYYDDILLMKRVHRYPVVYKLVWFMERVLFKLEKWGRC